MQQFTIKFDGRETAHHRIDARQLGNSLIGIDRVVSVGMMLMVNGRVPRPRERVADFYVAAREPEKGSVSIETLVENVPWILPLAGELVKAYSVDFVRNFISWVLLWHGGRKSEAEGLMDGMIEVLKETNRSHEATTEAWQKTFLVVIDRLAPAAKQIVEPVGRTASELQIGSAGPAPTVIDEPTADAIRSKEDLELTEKEQILVTVDGIIRRNKSLRLIMEDGAYEAAEVRDPIFELDSNIYMDAFHSGTQLLVTVRKALRAGKLYRMYVLDGEVPPRGKVLQAVTA